MSPREKVLADALELPEAERAELVRDLLASLDGVDVGAGDAWRDEIERRSLEVIDGKVELLDGPGVMAELRALDEE